MHKLEEEYGSIYDSIYFAGPAIGARRQDIDDIGLQSKPAEEDIQSNHFIIKLYLFDGVFEMTEMIGRIDDFVLVKFLDRFLVIYLNTGHLLDIDGMEL